MGTRFEQVQEQRAVNVGMLEGHGDVLGAHCVARLVAVEARRIDGGEHLDRAAWEEALLDLSRRVFIGEPVRVALSFFRQAEIEDRANVKRRKECHVFARQAREPCRAVDLTFAGHPARSERHAAEVTTVERAGQSRYAVRHNWPEDCALGRSTAAVNAQS